MSEYEAKILKLDDEIMLFQINTEFNLTLSLNLEQAFYERSLNIDRYFNECRLHFEDKLLDLS